MQLYHLSPVPAHIEPEQSRTLPAADSLATAALVALPEPPRCTCGTVPDGKSGNFKLDVKASYSPYKYVCFPSLRTFLYSDGPRYLTKVTRKPDVIEVDKNGKVVYNG